MRAADPRQLGELHDRDAPLVATTARQPRQFTESALLLGLDALAALSVRGDQPGHRPAGATLRLEPCRPRRSRPTLRALDSFKEFVGRHPAVAIVSAAAILFGSYATWAAASVAPVWVPEQVLDRCLPGTQGGEGISWHWELLPPRWVCVYTDRNGTKRRVRLAVTD